MQGTLVQEFKLPYQGVFRPQKRPPAEPGVAFCRQYGSSGTLQNVPPLFIPHRLRHFRIIHKGYAELLCSYALRQQLRHDHQPLVAGIGIVVLPAAGGKGQDGIFLGEGHTVKIQQFFRATVSKKLVRSSPVGLGAI